MKVFSIIAAILITSCGSIPDNVQQCIDTVRDRPYEINVYDCSNMSYRLCVLLEKKGYNCAVIVYANHSIARVLIGSEYYYIDPTNTKFTFVKRPDNILEVWTVRQIHFIKDQRYIKLIKKDYTGE